MAEETETQPSADRTESFYVPGGYSIYSVDGVLYLGYGFTGGNGARLTYRLDEEYVDAIFPDGAPKNVIEVTVDEETQTWAAADGDPFAVFDGGPQGVLDLRNTDKDPFDQWTEEWRTLAARDPELYRNREFLSLYADSILEGYAGTEKFTEELMGLGMFEGMNRSEVSRRLFVGQLAQDDFDRELFLHKRDVKRAMESYGIDADEFAGVVDTLSMERMFGRGDWDNNDYLLAQLELASETPESLDLDPTLAKALQGFEGGSFAATDGGTIAYEELKAAASDWVGPYQASLLDDKRLKRLASRIDSGDEAANVEFLNWMKGARTGVFSAYGDNENVMYADIVDPYKNMVSTIWGEAPDEMDPFFQSVVQMNDLEEARKQITRRGINMGKERAVNDAMTGLLQGFGGQVARGGF